MEPKKIEVLQRHFYYPFGMGMDGTWRQVEPYQSRYRYNGKELVLGLDWYAYGFRHYDAGVGRFMGVDPLAERFAHVTAFNYAENESVGNIDLWGLQKVNVNDVRNTKGEIISRNVTVSLNVKVLNLSSKDNFYFNNSLSRAVGIAERTFSTTFSAQVLDSPEKGLTSKEVPINVKFYLSVEQISHIDQVSIRVVLK